MDKLLFLTIFESEEEIKTIGGSGCQTDTFVIVGFPTLLLS